MKRRGDKIHDQPVSKKSDVTASTDLRSKIGAKLQTLLNGITSDSSLYTRSRRHMYEDLFTDGPHSEIIIDPNVVVKIEDTDSEDEGQIPTQDFLSTAKSRLTELLNKRKNSKKENSHSSPESAPTSSVKSKTLQSFNSLNKKSKNSTNAESLNAPHSDVLISQAQLQNVCVVLEDIIKSKNRTKFFHSKELAKSQRCSTNQKPCFKIQKKSLDKHEKNKTAKDNSVVFDEVVSIHETCDHVDSYVNYGIPSSSQSQSTSCSTKTLNFAVNSKVDVPESSKRSELFLNDYNLAPEVILNVGKGNVNISATGDDSGAIGDPGDFLNNEAVSCDISNEPLIDDNDDSDVILLCEKRPTYEVITLEEDNNTGDIVEEIQTCVQCGKTFRAKSLLNFHIRMHGSDLSISELSSSTSVSKITKSKSINS